MLLLSLDLSLFVPLRGGPRPLSSASVCSGWVSLYSFTLPFSFESVWLLVVRSLSSAVSRFQFRSVLAGSASRHSASQCGRLRCSSRRRVDSSATAALLVCCVSRLYISVCKRFFLLRPGLVDLPLEQARTVFCQKKGWSQRLCDKCLANIDSHINVIRTSRAVHSPRCDA